MADLGQAKEDLELKVAQTELLIEEKKFAYKKIVVAIMEIDRKKETYEQSLKDIKKQVEMHKKDLSSLEEAVDKKGES